MEHLPKYALADSPWLGPERSTTLQWSDLTLQWLCLTTQQLDQRMSSLGDDMQMVYP
jgi:hypothetical protein